LQNNKAKLTPSVGVLGTTSAAPSPFRLGDPALWEPSPSHPILV